MAKRHYKSHHKSHKKHHSDGGHHADKFNDEFRHDKDRGGMIFHGGHYEGMDSRRRQEMEDAGMIREDHSAVANLPQGVVMRPYPKTGPYMPEGLDDTIGGIDKQMDYDDSQRRAHFYPKKV